MVGRFPEAPISRHVRLHAAHDADLNPVMLLPRLAVLVTEPPNGPRGREAGGVDREV